MEQEYTAIRRRETIVEHGTTKKGRASAALLTLPMVGREGNVHIMHKILAESIIGPYSCASSDVWGTMGRARRFLA
jgi:hypothetical protein